MKKYCLCILLASVLQLNAQSIRDSVALESFMDGTIIALMKEKHIAGATLSIVHEGKVILKKGYGFSDYKNQIPVNPETTLFRIGSISKMFVWTSVMQLVSQGRLDLNADINTYLNDFKLVTQYNQPITLKHLMTHTPGFEDLVIGLFANDESKLLPLGTILKNEIPEQIRPPNTQASYSNHGTGMAAYIVEQVSGMSFNEYVEKNIIGPLGMKYTTFRQPVPPALARYQSKGYSFNDNLVEKDFEYVPLYPVGAAGSSAEDMTHFMLAFLQHGKYTNFQMLDSTTLATMKGVAHLHHPRVNPMRYGFMDISQNGVTVIGHGGDTFWFHSLMALLPDHNTGFFLSFNTNGGGGTYLDVFEAFMDRYYPDTLVLQPPIKVSTKWLERFAGEYEVNRYTHSDLTKVASLFGRVTVSVKDSTRLAVSISEETLYYVPIDSTTFREEFKSELIAFERNENGKVVRMYNGLLAIIAFDKISGVQSATLHYLIFSLVFVLGLVTLSYWPLVAIIRRHYVLGPRARPPMPPISKAIAWTNFLLYFLFLVGMVASLSTPEELVFGVPLALKISLVFPLVMILTTLGMLLIAVILVSHKRYRLRGRVFYIVLCVASILALWQLNYWNLLGFYY